MATRSGQATSSCCAALWCNNSKRKSPELSLFRFPNDTSSYRCQKWIEYARRPDLYNKSEAQLQGYMLCSQHFDSTAFLNPERNRLIRTAVPSILPSGFVAKMLNILNEQDDRQDSRNDQTGELDDVQENAQEETYIADHAEYILPNFLQDVHEKPAAINIGRYELNHQTDEGTNKFNDTENSQDVDKKPAAMNIGCYKLSRQTEEGMTFCDAENVQKETFLTLGRYKLCDTENERKEMLVTDHRYTTRNKDKDQKIEELIKKNAQLKAKNAALRAKVYRLQKKNLECAKRSERIQKILNASKRFLNNNTLAFLRSQLHNQKRMKRGIRWTERDRMFALQVYFRGPKAYKLLAKTFTLPSIRSLQKLLQSVRVKAGVSNCASEILKESGEHLSSRNKV